ncbi:MAG: hypothetical protein AAF648_13990 [Pseudomonadota bacterium]
MIRFHGLLWCGAWVLSSVAAPTWAESTSLDPLAKPCLGCHSLNERSPTGNASTPSMPSLSGWTAQELLTRLLAYRRGTADATLMNRLSRGYSEAELARIADAIGVLSENR